MNSIGKLIEISPKYKHCSVPNKELQIGLSWQRFLSIAREYFPFDLRPFISLGQIPFGYPPQYLAEYDGFRFAVQDIAPIKIKFSATSSLISFEVPYFAPASQGFIWLYSEAEIYFELSQALIRAREVFSLRESFINQKNVGK